MYGIDNSNGAGAKMSAGITGNVSLVSVGLGDFQGNATLDFSFMDENGGQFKHRVFPLDEQRAFQYAKDNLTQMKAKPGEFPAAFTARKQTAQKELPNAVAKAYKKEGDLMMHLLLPFKTRDEITGALSSGVASFADYGNKIITLLGDSYASELVRVKLTFNSKGYTQFPKSANSPFIQNMKTGNTLAIDAKYDKVIADVPTPEAAYEQPVVDFSDMDDVPDLFSNMMSNAEVNVSAPPVFQDETSVLAGGDTDDWA